MNPEKLVDSVGYIDTDLVERAEKRASGLPRVHKRVTKRFAACAACLVLTVALGVSAAFAAGVFGGREEYFSGATEQDMELILSASASASNDEIELRLDGAIADGHSCYMLISFIGLTEEIRERFTAQNNLDEQALFELYALDGTGERVEFPIQESGSYTKDGGFGRKAMSMMPDADMSYLVIGTFTGNARMSDVEKVCFSYEGLTLELDVGEYITPEYELYPENPSGSTVTDFYVSRLGYSFTVPLTDESTTGELNPDDLDFDDLKAGITDLRLICQDGSIIKPGYCGSGGSADGDEICFEYGRWAGGSAVSLGLIDPENYLGVQLNGENYYFAD